MTVNRSDFQKGRLASVSAADTIIVNDEDGTLEPQVIDFAGLAASAPFTGAFWPNSSTALTGAGLANDDRIPVLDGSVPKYITADQLAQGSQFTSRYKPLASDSLFIHATQLIDTSGTTSLGTLGNAGADERRVGVRLFPDSDRFTHTVLSIPLGWSTIGCYLWWSNPSASAGDVRWSVRVSMIVDGTDTDTALTIGSGVTATAPAQYIVNRTLMWTPGTVTAGGLMGMVVSRIASSGADTLAANAGVLGVELVRAS